MISQTASIGAMLVRELNSLRLEIEAYPTDADLCEACSGLVWEVLAGRRRSIAGAPK